MAEEVTIAGKPIGTSAIRDSLLMYAAEHGGTLRFVDRYARRDASQRPGPVTAADIVMLNAFAARPSPDLTVELLTTSDLYGWETARKHAPATLLDGPDDPVLWAGTEGVSALRELSVDIVQGMRIGANGSPQRKKASRHATASKLLYVRWPEMVPVVDSELEAAYGARADERLEDIQSRIVRRWAAIRADLQEAASVLRAAASDAATRLADQEATTTVANDLRQLSPLRVLDIVVWAR